MFFNRRQFLLLATGFLGACRRNREPVPKAETKPSPAASAPSDPPDRIVDAGPITGFPSDGVYDDFRQQGFFVVRRGGRLLAISSICTHEGCRVRSQSDQSFLCKCHGSRFSPDGTVVKGPAQRDLPWLAVKLDQNEHLLVNLDRQIGHAV